MSDFEALSRLLAGELSLSEAALLRERLQHEPELAQAWQQLQRLDQHLISLPREIPPFDLDQRVIRRSRKRWWLAILPIAAAILAYFLGMQDHHSSPKISVVSGIQDIEGQVSVVAAGVGVDVDGKIRISVEPMSRNLRNPSTEVPVNSITKALLTITVLEGVAYIPSDAQATPIQAGETRVFEGAIPGNMIGKEGPMEAEIDAWLGEVGSFNQGKITIVVFFETWCPHCQEPLVNLEADYQQYRDQGLNMVGLTRGTRTSTDEEIRKFISDWQITFPIGKEKNSSVTNRFEVMGVPATVILKDRKVIWSGNPNEITDALILSLLAS